MLANHLGILLITKIDKIKRLTPQQANLKAKISTLAEVTLLEFHNFQAAPRLCGIANLFQ